ncbi:MAG: M48 family metalloprotease, partial [Proteobacteria bacterium]|nr:M48 family metalloprotease [Pseudomonadota bacterium]
MKLRRRAMIALAWLLPAVVACTSVNPATGDENFTLFMSPAQEARIGAEEHAKILDRFGGVYDDPKIGGYVAEIGGRLVANSETPRAPFRFTVLNTPDVNAFALPGGYVYVTRGLIALANSESELAGVLAHEIGHVVARHAAQRYSRSVVAGIGGAILGAITNAEIGQIASLGSELYLSGFSREQEYESDTLGVRYLRRTGYDPGGMASFLRTLIAEKDLNGKLAGVDPNVAASSFFATHPRTIDRVNRAVAQAGGAAGVVRRDAHLDNLAGLVFGDDPSQGIVRGREFIHPELRFRFEVPPGFRLFNTAEAVFARESGGGVIKFDSAGRETHPDILVYLREIWMPKARLERQQRLEINGMDAATATTRLRGTVGNYSGPLDVRLIAIAAGRREIYRFMFMTPPNRTVALREDFQRTTFS